MSPMDEDRSTRLPESEQLAKSIEAHIDPQFLSSFSRGTNARRRLLQSGAALTFAPWFVRHALAADAPRFSLGVASGQPRADGVVLWTRLTGAGLPERTTVQWEIATDEA